ncbi:golgin subfamily A member 6-like protein 1 [Xyrichtys novacula]|uniref:Golgin subfamily A member 6-like protein 1 n=1 Tax=Xyrichtys novacula TaxID=13765 RepID=A0AAV1FGP4_XYRNO|nr:golgin subfamily A member 6-like protein 1 [Xyrichtys novacula]CAJ1060591.1 golgin subfamily A member 6-like protein 1 [Xyrichtys novacula]
MSSSTSRMEQNRTEEATNYDFQGFDSEEELNPLLSGVGQDSEDSDEQDQIGSPDSVNKSSPEETKKSVKRGLISRMKAISVQTFAQESILNVRSRVRRRLAHRRRQEADSSDTSMLLESEDSLSNEIITPEDQHTNSESEEIGPSTALCKSDCERRLDVAQKCHIEKVAELEREKEEIQAIKENLFSQVSRLQDESITNERNRSLLTEKVASLETRLDEKELENGNLVAEIDDLKERNRRQEKHYGEKVPHLTRDLQQAQDRERALNQQVTSLQTSFNKTQDEATQLRAALHDCERRLYVAQKCHIEKVAELERVKKEIQAIKENLFSQVSRLQDESITNERNRSLLTEKVASLETRLDEKERENENLVAEIDDLKERNWRQEKHYGEKVLHLITALEQAQDNERALNQHSEETISKLKEELKAKQEEEIQAPSERHLNSTGVQTDEISPDLEISPEPQQLETPAIIIITNTNTAMSSSTSRMEQNRTEEVTNYDFQGFDSVELNPLPSGVGQDSEDLDEQDQIGSPDSVKKSSPEETKKSGMRGLISRMKAISVQTFAQESILKVRSRVRRRLAHRRRQEADSSDTSMLLESEDSLSNEIITPEDQHTNSESEEIGPSTALCKSDCERRLQDESITNERNRSLLTEKVASLETRLDEKELENGNLVAEIDDLKERNWRQEKHYGEKVFHPTTALEQAQDNERTLNQHSEETIRKLREELKTKQEEEILAPSERHLNSTGVQTDEISPDLEISPEPQQLETPAAEAQSESLWKRSLRGALSVGKFIGVSSACALVAVGILSIGLIAHCDCPCDPFSHLLESLTIHNTGHPS